MTTTIERAENALDKAQPAESETAPAVKEKAAFLPDGRPNSALWKIIGAHLQRPIPYKERPGRGNKLFKYIDARDVHDRLDEVVGPGNWATSFRVLDVEKAIVECTLIVFGVAKSDIGYPNSPDNPEDEPLKSAYSDSIKRAGVSWGIGRFLYDK